MKYLRQLLTCGLLLGSAALFAQAGEQGVTSARLAERFLQEHPEFAKLFSFDEGSGTARCSDAKAWASFEEFRLAFASMTVEDATITQHESSPLREVSAETPADRTEEDSAREKKTTSSTSVRATTKRPQQEAPRAVNDASIAELRLEIDQLGKKVESMGPNADSTDRDRLEQLKKQLARQQLNNQPR